MNVHTFQIMFIFLICSKSAQLEVLACEKVLMLIRYTCVNPKNVAV